MAITFWSVIVSRLVQYLRQLRNIDRNPFRLLHSTPEGPCRRIRQHYPFVVGTGDTRTMPCRDTRHVWGTWQGRRGDPLGGFAAFDLDQCTDCDVLAALGFIVSCLVALSDIFAGY